MSTATAASTIQNATTTWKRLIAVETARTCCAPAKTTAFEVGADWNFVSDYTIALTAYYRSEVEQFTHYPNETWQGPRISRIRYSRTPGQRCLWGYAGSRTRIAQAVQPQFLIQFVLQLPVGVIYHGQARQRDTQHLHG